MKSITLKFLYILGILALLSIGSACNKKAGCPVNENVHVKTTKKGKVKGKAKTKLFPKKMTKKKRRRKKKG